MKKFEYYQERQLVNGIAAENHVIVDTNCNWWMLEWRGYDVLNSFIFIVENIPYTSFEDSSGTHFLEGKYESRPYNENVFYDKPIFLSQQSNENLFEFDPINAFPNDFFFVISITRGYFKEIK